MTNTDPGKIADHSSASEQYLKKESGQSEVPKNPAHSPGTTSPIPDDIENGKGDQDSDEPSSKEKNIAKQIKEK